jgi:hypothetical protein
MGERQNDLHGAPARLVSFLSWHYILAEINYVSAVGGVLVPYMCASRMIGYMSNTRPVANSCASYLEFNHYEASFAG